MTHRLRILAALAGVSLAGGCNGLPPGTYPIAVTEAFARLKDDKLIDLRRNRQCGIVIDFVPSVVSGGEIRWTVYSGGQDMVWFRALLTPVSPTQTSIVVEVQPGESGKPLYDGDYFPPHPAVVQPLRAAVEEAIAAKLEGRAFDPERAPRNRDDDVCDVQRAALHEGRVFRASDPPGTPPHPIPR